MKYIVAACVVLGGFLLTLIHTPTFADNAKYPESILPGKEHPQEQKDHSPVQQHHARQTITLDEAIRLAISHNPGLAAAIHEMKARVGAAQQDAMLPNPVLVAEFEEFGGSGIYSGTDVMTSNIGISQEILLGGKLSVRKLLAEEIRKQTILEKDAQLVTLSSEVGKKFIDVYIAQEKLKLARNDLQLTLASAEAISKRVASGEASPLEKTKFSVETAAAETTVKRVARILQAARLALAATWGSTAAHCA
jgi:cobalt-zinc-cadmium efflux system outer membrane protein